MASHMIPAATPKLRGMEVLHDPAINKSTAYTEAERQALGLVGLVLEKKANPAWDIVLLIIARYNFLPMPFSRTSRFFWRLQQ
jgi:hypothetical protein